MRQYGRVGDQHAERVQTCSLALEMMNSGHSGFSSLRLGASWSVGDDNWMQPASTLPIVNTTLEAEVQTISRQLYAILVVNLDGKALGIVQLVGKGEGLWKLGVS